MEDQVCRVCGCTDYDCTQCVERTGQPCHWVDEDLCSACVAHQPPTNNFHQPTLWQKNVSRGAVLSECGKYRFKLWRIWDDSKPLVLWIMHNPSTADADNDDPTIRRIIAFTKSWGYGGLYVGNLFPYRSTKPKNLKKLSDFQLLRNPENYHHVKEMYDKCELRMLAYGRPFNGIGKVESWEGDFHYLKLTKEGFPAHPLYLKSELTPLRYG